MNFDDIQNFQVLNIERANDLLHVTFEHKEKVIELVASGEIREEAKFYIGDGVEGRHPNPGMPLDLVEVAAKAEPVQREKEGAIHVAHYNVGKEHILHHRPFGVLYLEPVTAVVKDTVRDHNILHAAIGFRAQAYGRPGAADGTVADDETT